MAEPPRSLTGQCFEAHNNNWKKTEEDSNSTGHQSYAGNPEKRPARDNFITIPAVAVNSYTLKANDTLFDKMYGPKRELMSPWSTNMQNNKIGIPHYDFRASKFFRPRYKSLKTSCDCKVYKVYSNNEKSVMFRNNYELWSNVNYFPESRSVGHKIRRSEPEEELSGDSRFIYDDDYSLINYVDSGKWGSDVTANQRGQTVKRTPKKKNSKREAEDREFSVMFHSRKENENREKFSNSRDFFKNGKKKSMLHFEKKKYKHEFGSKPERKITFLERRNNMRESYNHVARTPLNVKSKRKYPFWLSKKEKVGTKHETFSAILTSPKASLSSLVPPRKVLHWATTRSYVAAISAQNKVTPATLSPNAPLVPPALIPFLNLNLTDSLIAARKSEVVSYSSTPGTMNRPAVLVNPSPQYLRVGNNNLDLRSLSLNPNLAFPFGFQMPIAKPLENNAGVYGPPVQATTPVVFFFNAPTEGINPLSNHLDKFKNTTTWNAKQGPPGSLNAWSNLVNLVNFQMDNLVNNHSESIPANLARPFPRRMEKTRKSVDIELTTPAVKKTQFVQDIKINPPLLMDPHAGLEVTQGPIIGAEALVNFLQNALLPHNALMNELGLREATKAILSSTTTEPCNLRELPIDNNLIRILAPTRTVLTEGPLLRLFTTEEPVRDRFSEIISLTARNHQPQTEPAPLLRLLTTEEPLMDRFSDIISRNADRKIPIVYDIEEAPQLLLKTNKLNVSSLGHVLHDMPVSRIQRNIIDRHVILKKNKTSIKHKLAGSQTNLTTPWLNHIMTTTENMLYSEMKVQSQLEANKPKAKKLNLLFKSKAKPNPTPVTTEMVTKQVGKTVKSFTTNAPKKRARKACSDSVSNETKPCMTEETEPLTRSFCCCCCTCCNRKDERGFKRGRGGSCGRSTTCARELTFEDSGTNHHSPSLELTTPISCVPYNISMGSISCPSCHHEFTYKLGFRNLIV